MITGLQMPDAVTVMVSTELLEQLTDVWSPPVQIQIQRTPGMGSGYEMTARPHVVDGQTSDGHHTFDELYWFRLLYNAALFNVCAGLHPSETVFTHIHKSWRHADGELCFGGGWFIVKATLPTGQISNHYPAEAWDLFTIPEQERADYWDGHDAQDVAGRLEDVLRAGR